MAAMTPLCAEVLGQLPSLLARAVAGREAAALVDELVAAGWRPAQLQSRIGAEPSQGSVDRDAARVLQVLAALRDEVCPDVLHAQDKAHREQQRQWERVQAPAPADPEVREAHLARIRAQLKGLPRRRPEPAPRTRPACSLCADESAYFVTREVHLCGRCVAHLATGRARLADAG